MDQEKLEPNKRIIRILSGMVVSNKMDKTAVVKVDRVKVHPIYKKRYKASKKYKVHDPKNECQVGDEVTFKQVRPLSKGKCWLLVSRKGETVKKEINQDKPEV